MKHKILVIDDDPEIVQIIELILRKEGYEIEKAGSADEGMQAITRSRPDLIILDVRLPGISGKEFCSLLKSKEAFKDIPIIMISGEYIAPKDRVTGLDLGAEDYVLKPFDQRELAARIRVVLRRTEKSEEGALSDGELHINPQAYTVKIKDKFVALSPIEFELLHILLKRKGEVVKREFLLENIWKDKEISNRSPDIYIARIRKKLGSIGKRIRTVERVGYRYLPKN